MSKAQSNSVAKTASSLPRRTQDPLEALAEFATHFECRPGQTISPRENPLEHWYRTISGVARKCLVLPSGRRQIVDLLLPGDFFGVAAPEGHSFTLEAVVDGTRIASYPRSRVEKLAESDPRIAKEIRDLAFHAIGRLEAQLVILGRTTAIAKVGSFLLNMEERLADRPVDGIELPMSRYDIADYLAISVETVSRALTSFKQRGVIRFSGSRRLRILDHTALKCYSRPDGNGREARQPPAHAARPGTRFDQRC